MTLRCVEPGPINREMRNLISSLKNHNEQLKGEVARYRRKLRETQLEVNKVRTRKKYVCTNVLFRHSETKLVCLNSLKIICSESVLIDAI